MGPFLSPPRQLGQRRALGLDPALGRWQRGRGAGRLGIRERVAASLPPFLNPSPVPFTASQQLLKAEKKKKKRLEKHFEKQGREKRPSFPAAPSPPPAASACQLCLPTQPRLRRRCCRMSRVHSPSLGAAAGHGDHCPDTLGCWEWGIAPPTPPNPSSPRAQCWLLPDTSPIAPANPTDTSLHPQPWGFTPSPCHSPWDERLTGAPRQNHTARSPLAPVGARVSTGTSCAQVGACSRSPFPPGTLPWPAVPRNRLAEPAAHPGTHRPATMQPPRLSPKGIPPGAWLLQGPTVAGSARGNPLPWQQFRRRDPFGWGATARSGHPRRQDRVHRPGSVLSAAFLSPPSREGSGAVPAAGSSAHAAGFAAWHGAGGGRAWGTWGSEDAPNPV